MKIIPVTPALVLAALLFSSEATAQLGQYRGPENEVRGRVAEQPVPASPDGLPGAVPGGPAPRPGTSGQQAPVARRRILRTDQEGYRRWEFWWEHNKDRYLGLWNLENRSGDGPLYGTPDYYLGKVDDVKPGSTFAVSEQERRDKIVPALLQSLTSTEPRVRAAALLALAKMRDPDVVDALLRYGSDLDPGVRKAAVLGLGLSGDLRVVPQLLHVLEDAKLPDEHRLYAGVALGYLRQPEVTGYLLSFLEKMLVRQAQGLEDIQIGVLIGLGINGDPKAVPALEAFLRDSRVRDDDLRAMMCEALGKIGDLLALPVLLRVLEIGDIQERRSAALAIGELDFSSEAQQQLEELLRAKDAWAEKDSLTKAALEHFDRLIESRVQERQEAERQLRHFRDRAAYRLGEIMKHDADGQVRNFAAISLGKIAGASSKDGLLWGLESGYARSLQGFSALGLGILGDRSVALRVRERLTETYGEEELRGAFALCLGLLRDRESGSALVKILTKSSHQPSLRGYCAIGLGLMGYREAAPELKKILAQDNDDELMRPVALAMGLLGDREATDDLCRTLVDGRDRLVRGSAAMSHGLLRDFASMEPLLGILRGSSKPEVREMAVIALGYLAEKGELPALSFLARDHNYRLPSQKASELLRIL